MIVRLRIDNIRKILVRRGIHNNHAAYLADKTGLSVVHWYMILQGHREAGGLARERLQKHFSNIRWDDIFIIQEEQ